MSCKKESKAPPVIPPRIEVTLHSNDVRGQSSEIWLTTKQDTLTHKKINITLPEGQLIAPQAKLTKDYSGIVFVSMNADEKTTGIYYCKLDGSGLKKIADASTDANSGVTLQGVY